MDSITPVCCTLTSCLPQVHHPFALSPSLSCQNPHKHPRLLYLLCSTSSNSTHYSTLAGVTIAASSTPVAHIAVNSYSGTQSLVLLLHQHPAYSCVLSHLHLTVPISNKHPQQPPEHEQHITCLAALLRRQPVSSGWKLICRGHPEELLQYGTQVICMVAFSDKTWKSSLASSPPLHVILVRDLASP